MIVQFASSELENLTFELVQRQNPAPADLSDRERIWDEQMARVRARNGHMWNGEIYPWEDVLIPGENQVILRAGTCEYNGVAFHFHQGRE